MHAAVGDQLSSGAEDEGRIFPDYRCNNQHIALYGAGFVTNFLLGMEPVKKDFSNDLIISDGFIFVTRGPGENTLAEWPNYRLSHLHKFTESFVKLRLEFAVSSIDLLLTDKKQNLAVVEERFSFRQYYVHFIYSTLWYEIHGKNSRLDQFFHQRFVVGSHLFGKGDKFLTYFPVFGFK